MVSDTLKIRHTPHQRHVVFLFVILFAVAWLFSCQAKAPEEKNQTDPAKKNTGIHKTFERGPISVHLDIDKTEITIADRLNLTLSVISDEDYDVQLPKFGERLEQFGIVDYHTSQPSLTGNNQSKISRSYILEPFLSGDYTIPPMTVHFKKKGDSDDTLHEISTEEITVHATSLLPENFEELTLHDIKPPEDLPQSYDLWLWTGGITLVLLISGIVVFIIIRKSKSNGDNGLINKIPAHQQAFDELNVLVSEQLVEKGAIKEFYHKISDILRRYIENRFFIRAPELTTEEFLINIQTANDFDNSHKILLKNFLTLCDLVKFAKHQPQTEDIQKTFDSCKEFILGTQEKE